MKNIYQVIFFSLIYALSSNQIASAATQHERNYFQFEIANYHTQRQSGQTLNLYVRYAYTEGLDPSKYIDYRKIRDKVMENLEPNEKFPTNTYWEIIATDMGRTLVKSYSIKAISIQIEILDNPAGGEPGIHGPIFTIGDIAPLDVHTLANKH